MKDLTNLDRNIRDGVFRVYGYQQPNGGWVWYAPNDFGLEANPHTTGYAIWSLAAMKRLGYEVDEGVYRRGRHQALNLFRELARRADERKVAPPGKGEHGESLDPAADAAFLLMCLAPTGEPIAGMLNSSAAKALTEPGPDLTCWPCSPRPLGRRTTPRVWNWPTGWNRWPSRREASRNWEGPRENWHGYASGDVVPPSMPSRLSAC